MSAILGGATSISNLSYDEIYHKSNEFGERIARNQLLILKEEAGFNQGHFLQKGAIISKRSPINLRKRIDTF